MPRRMILAVADLTADLDRIQDKILGEHVLDVFGYLTDSICVLQYLPPIHKPQADLP